MKAISKITIGLVAAALLIVGCGGDGAKSSSNAKVTKVIAEESLGLRKTDLYSEDDTTSEKTQYREAAPGTSSKIKRAFQDAPPMIPHSTEGMLPITVKEGNQCIGCHMPDVAMYMDPKPTPIPESHFTDFRPKHKLENGVFKKVVDNYKNEVAIKKTDKLQGARFNCSQCHAPQSQGNLAVENTFEAAYKKPDGASKSSWTGSALTEALDTVGKKSYVTEEDIDNSDSPAGVSPWTHH